MNAKTVAQGVAVLLITSACSQGHTNPSFDSGQSTVVVNGHKPDDYFDGFVAKRIGLCPDQMSQRFLVSDSMLVGKNEQRQDIRANISIYMHDDHTYVANFEENDVFQYTDIGTGNIGYSSAATRDKRLVGTWKVAGELLELSSFAVGAALTYNNQPAITLQFTNDIISLGLKGQTTIAQNGRSGYDENHNIICK